MAPALSRRRLLTAACAAGLLGSARAADGLRIAPFRFDVTPPPGSTGAPVDDALALIRAAAGATKA